LKKFSKLFAIFFVMSCFLFNFTYANPPMDVGENVTVEQVGQKLETGVEQAATTVNSLAYTIVEQISDKSLPVCTIFILWGAVMYFILGIRNLYKKRQGLLLMWGAFTFVVIAKIINFVYWFALVR